ncbi:TPA: cytochrome C oxidase subunit IV family protein [Pseudomonas aeruginosa]|uniref:cytochrome C oxidase subunit IV family protein n=1 Tax=Pseudomonas aeruginosa TaxID=287 RepID=UPI0037290877
MAISRLPYFGLWLFLVASSLFGAWLTGDGIDPAWATSIVMLIASLKVVLVMTCFMELGSAPGRWQWPFALWLVLVTALLIGGFIVS